MEFQINNNSDLLEFINRNDVTPEQGFEVTAAFFKVIPLMFDDLTKEQLIKTVMKHIELMKTIKPDWEQPIFLGCDIDNFNIKKIYGTNENANRT